MWADPRARLPAVVETMGFHISSENQCVAMGHLATPRVLRRSDQCQRHTSGIRASKRPEKTSSLGVGIYSWDRRHTVVRTPAIEVTRGTVSKVCLRAGDPRGQCSILVMERECY